ncbi:5'-nucleotidase C-terminal domain-containing protein [Nocardioides sp. SOB77]|uniref:5'-nucleotidase C-terminal domain-containing protein n=1 Tax=Nocardioides oceani TaxID=3058369 RepID=A0ABT8FHZ3_9ACTN|nr:5'-nucleotidase C-terminal domain-containing protein [Nocardioides oceani]MDN4174145.1 5'-nucleotidase C-terminal domain-containing protein [Nocardioides oceani]
MPATPTRFVAPLGLAVAATTLVLVPAPAHAATVDITLLNINDFHGRIDANTTKFATTVEQIRAEAGDENTLLLSAGDNIGASLFASSNQQDQPTLDVLDALELAGSAVGNHEFDRGFADLEGRVQAAADFDYLGANVYKKGTTTPALDEYATYEVGGVTVGVVGVVTEETPSLVSPAGISSLTFGDPVEAVNRVAAELTDGVDTADNGEADVIVAEYHEGAGAGTPDGSTLEEEVAAGGVFADIVTKTSPAVDVIFTGHTHKQYAWTADGRPVVQTGSYGENVGRVDLTVDDATGEVTVGAMENVARAATADLTLPRVAAVDAITKAALADAAAVGNRPVAQITADITTAYADGKRDDRASESTLGGLVANALRDGLSDIGQPDLGLTNPGGLRAELLFAGAPADNPANTDGVVTFAEANAVLPFNNTVALVKLTGASLKKVLEQQWQTNADGTVPSRPYLQLGMSDNVRVTADPSKPAGERITSVRIDGVPLDPAKTYTVSTLSFLATGGDNFRAFTEGTSTDTGLLDAELWRDYLAANSPISPDFARQQVEESGLPTSVSAGDAVSFTLADLDLTSLGSPANTTVEVSLVQGRQTVPVGDFPVTAGAAEVSFTVPAGLDGAWGVAVVAQPSGTVVGAEPAPARVKAEVTATEKGKATVGEKVTIKVAVAAGEDAAAGKVKVFRFGKATTVKLNADGKATVKLAAYGTPGQKKVRVKYLGNDTTKSDTQIVKFWVSKK